MTTEVIEARWRALGEEAFTGMAEWRTQHPQATFREIEAAVDERLARVRARMLEDAALLSAATEVQQGSERPRCPACGEAMVAHGRSSRRLVTNHDQAITLTRQRAVCPACGAGLFPPRR